MLKPKPPEEAEEQLAQIVLTAALAVVLYLTILIVKALFGPTAAMTVLVLTTLVGVRIAIEFYYDTLDDEGTTYGDRSDPFGCTCGDDGCRRLRALAHAQRPDRGPGGDRDRGLWRTGVWLMSGAAAEVDAIEFLTGRDEDELNFVIPLDHPAARALDAANSQRRAVAVAGEPGLFAVVTASWTFPSKASGCAIALRLVRIDQPQGEER